MAQSIIPWNHLSSDAGFRLLERGDHPILKLACAIADLAGSEDIQSSHLTDVLHY